MLDLVIAGTSDNLNDLTLALSNDGTAFTTVVSANMVTSGDRTGDILIARGQYKPAANELRASADLNRRLAGADSWRAARSEASLAWTHVKLGDDASGGPALIDAQARLVKSRGAQDPAVRQASTYLAEYYRLHHREADATRVLATLGSR